MTPREQQWNGWKCRLWSIVGALSKPIMGNDPTAQGFMGIRRWVLTAGVPRAHKASHNKMNRPLPALEYGLLEGKHSCIDMLSYVCFRLNNFPFWFLPAAKSSKLAGWQITKTVAPCFTRQSKRKKKEPQEGSKSPAEGPFCVFTLSEEPLRWGHLSEGQQQSRSIVFCG